MNTKENWLIAWSIFRLVYGYIPEQIKYYPRVNKNIKYLLPIAEKHFHERENDFDISLVLKNNLEIHLKDKGFQKEWTGWKYTWVKFEEKDVPF